MDLLLCESSVSLRAVILVLSSADRQNMICHGLVHRNTYSLCTCLSKSKYRAQEHLACEQVDFWSLGCGGKWGLRIVPLKMTMATARPCDLRVLLCQLC